MKEIKEFCEKHVVLLPSDKVVSPSEAEKRASKFLAACAHITNWRHDFGNAKIKAESLEKSVYAAVLSQSEGKGVTEKKIEAEANPDYQSAREELEGVDNDMTFLKTYYDIFLNAHVFYRQLAKGDLA